ncbi:O-acetyl-ADP-ribose deacetylase [Streptomyces sp. NPDC048659]|uniref:O-acetyl-ADP-ribose deacetylase n=1 Tax=Streptomyces sp. NPDC048659 TaxID=3155489 RepID=UPI00342CBBCF
MSSRPRILLVLGDITHQHADVIVNAANSSLLGGGGVDGAIHRAGGPAILADCRALRAGHYGRGLPTGRAVATTAGNLAARWVVHTVGPVYDRAEDRSALLTSCYTEALRVAAGLGAETIAFPAVSTGIYGWPMADAARLAIRAVREAGAGAAGTGGVETAPPVREVRFVLYDEDAYEVFVTALAEADAAGR